jgi:hypothetical protein
MTCIAKDESNVSLVRLHTRREGRSPHPPSSNPVIEYRDSVSSPLLPSLIEDNELSAVLLGITEQVSWASWVLLREPFIEVAAHRYSLLSLVRRLVRMRRMAVA